jgi:dihydrofolate reductase
VTEVVYYVASSLDGYIATPDGGVEWLTPFEAAGIDYGYADFYGSVDAVLVGSHTYEQSLTFGDWPYPGKPVWVFSARPLPTPAAGVTVTEASPESVVARLEEIGIARAWLVGGGALAASFRAAGLISEYVVSVMPVILGQGIRVLGGRGEPEPLRLLEATPYPGGVMQLRYAPLGDDR